MRAFRAGFAALAFATTFAAGCSQGGSGALSALDIDPKSVEAQVAKLTGDAFKGKATAAADLAAVRDALPKEVTLSWGNLTFDAASGATVVSDVKLSPTDLPQVGLGIQELRLYDFDAAFAKARLSGQRLTEQAPLASRIDAKGVSVFGLAAMINEQMGGASSDAVARDPSIDVETPQAPSDDWPGATEPEPEFDFDGAMFRTSFERYDVGFGRILLHDIVLRPYEMTPAKLSADPADPLAQVMPFLQNYAAVLRTFGVDTFAAQDLKVDMAVTEMGQKMVAAFGAKSMGTRGLRGGDFDATYARGLNYLIDMGASGSAGAPAQNVAVSIDLFTIKDFHLDKLYGFLAKGVFPPRTETDLLSAGLWRSENETWSFAGKQLYSVAESSLDARKFHWFIPTELKTSGKNAVFDLVGLMELAEGYSAALSSELSPDMPPTMPDMKAIAAAFQKNGLSTLVMNYDFGWNWNATSGDAKVDLNLSGDKLMQVSTKFEGGFPSFKAVSDLVPENPEEANFDAIANVFDQKSTLKLVDINVADNGGLAKMFDLIAELGPIMAASDPQGVNPMEGQTGTSLRQMASSMITLMGATPDIAPFANPLALFIAQGGKLHIGLKPPAPMKWSAFGEKFASTTTPPGQALQELGLKVEHSK